MSKSKRKPKLAPARDARGRFVKREPAPKPAGGRRGKGDQRRAVQADPARDARGRFIPKRRPGADARPVRNRAVDRGRSRGVGTVRGSRGNRGGSAVDLRRVRQGPRPGRGKRRDAGQGPRRAVAPSRAERDRLLRATRALQEREARERAAKREAARATRERARAARERARRAGRRAYRTPTGQWRDVATGRPTHRPPTRRRPAPVGPWDTGERAAAGVRSLVQDWTDSETTVTRSTTPYGAEAIEIRWEASGLGYMEAAEALGAAVERGTDGEGGATRYHVGALVRREDGREEFYPLGPALRTLAGALATAQLQLEAWGLRYRTATILGLTVSTFR